MTSNFNALFRVHQCKDSYAHFLIPIVFCMTPGPSAMEGESMLLTKDISAHMMRRARYFHGSKHSTDARNNVQVLEEEKEQLLAQQQQDLLSLRAINASNCLQQQQSLSTSTELFLELISNVDQLLHCWRWIALVERLSIDYSNNEVQHTPKTEFSMTAWTAKGLIDAGVMKLLRMSRASAENSEVINSNLIDTTSRQVVLCCNVFHSPLRR